MKTTVTLDSSFMHETLWVTFLVLMCGISPNGSITVKLLLCDFFHNNNTSAPLEAITSPL